MNTSEEFDRWWEECDEAMQNTVAAHVRLLEDVGPNLGRPYADSLRGSAIPNLKELRIQHRGKPIRVLFAFDSHREALLLIGGIKSGDARWYRKAIARSEALFAHHLHELEDPSG